MTDQMNMDDPQPDVMKVDGRTKAGRAARVVAAARTPTSTLNAQKPASPSRSLNRGQYVGRNGEVLQRSDSTGQDPYEVDPKLKETGWDYQWIAVKVAGSADAVRQDHIAMEKNGWRPVHAQAQWNGVFFPPSYTGHIVIGDAGLYERPMQMSQDARREDLARARRQVADRNEQLIGGKANVAAAMRDGFDMNPQRYRGTGATVRMNIAPDAEAPAPSYQSADDSL